MPTSTNPKKIILKGTPIRKEGRAGGAITPGHLVTGVPGGVIAVHAVAGGNAAPAFAVEQDFLGKRITDAYALNDQVQYVVCRPGDEMYAFLAAGQNVAAGAMLESAGNGSLQAFTNQANQFNAIVCRAMEAVNNAAGPNPVRIKVEVV